MKKNGARVLHVITDQIRVWDIPRVLDELGHKVYTANMGTHVAGYYAKDSQEIIYAIEEFKIDCVTSYNFSESISYACMKKGVPYISWVYDTPQKELYTHYAFYPCNYIFVFDKVQEHRLKEIGLKNVFFMPLAIHGEKIKLELKANKATDLCEVAFVGQTYYKDNIERIVENAPEHIRREVYGCIETSLMKWEEKKSIHGMMSKECAEYFDGLQNEPIKAKYPYIENEFYYEAAVLSRMLAYRERVYILNKLAEKYDVNFYTFDKNTEEISDKVNLCPGIKYDAGISCIYRDAKININNTLHCIETGACLRVFEVMAAGGFLISNYQKELEELFVPGEEIVLYHNEEELLQLVDYYLTHEEERKIIARNGQRKVLAYHTLHIRFQRIMELVYENEKNRKEGYIEQQKNKMIQCTDEALASGKEADVKALCELFYNPIYDIIFTSDTDLGIIKEMLYIWKQEQQIKAGNVFDSVHSLQEAKTLYLRIKHILWRIESNCDDKICQQGILELAEKNVSALFLAWHIKVNMSKKKKMYLDISEYLWNISPARGIEIISYGLHDFPGDADMLMYKANYLLEAQCFMEALETLKSIPDPTEDVSGLVQELQCALGIV